MDSLITLADSTLYNNRLYSAKMDSISETVTRLADGQSTMCGKIDSIQVQLQQIAEYGTGFSSAVAIIAIPLIIALFAFAFTYLFSVITRINEKYNSEQISGMFKTSLSYRCYMWGSAISVGYIILMGVLSLVLSGNTYVCFIRIMNWSSLVVAGAYAVIILWFVHTCLLYDNHQKMLGIIEGQYNKEEGKPWSLNLRAQRLTDLCLYADRENNTNLFTTVLNKVNELDRSERLDRNKNSLFYTMRFYESIVDCFIQSPHDSEVERSLIWNWSQIFRHDQLPYTSVIYRMLGKMVEAVKRGRFSLFESFMVNCGQRYDYIYKVHHVSYAKGENVEFLKKQEIESSEIWHELREVHYLAAAHLFSTGHYEVAGVLRKGAGSSNSFFPTTAAQILKNYANCKEKQDQSSGSFIQMNMSVNKVIGHKYDLDMLEKFTAMLLLLSVEPEDKEKYLLDDKKQKILEDNKCNLVKFGRLWKKHTALISLYPLIQDRNIEDIIKDGMMYLVNGEIHRGNFDKGKKTTKNKKGKKNDEKGTTIYDLKITAKDEEPVKNLFDTILYSNQEIITEGLCGNVSDDKLVEVPLNAYTFLTRKEIVLDKEIWLYPEVVSDMAQVFRSRYLYIVFEALSKMRIKDVDMKWGEFEKIYLKHIGEKGPQYIIIDAGCHLDAMVRMDPLPKGNKWNLHRSFKGAYYYNASYGFMIDLRDTPLCELVNNTIMIVRFKDLPVLLPAREDGKSTVNITDGACKEYEWSSVQVTINPNLVAKYSTIPEVIRIRLLK